jgi:hypothetical protein
MQSACPLKAKIAGLMTYDIRLRSQQNPSDAPFYNLILSKAMRELAHFGGKIMIDAVQIDASQHPQVLPNIIICRQ